MKFSLNWIREFVPTDGVSPQEIGDRLTLHTCELEECIFVAQNFERVFAAKLTAVRDISGGKLHVGTFDVGAQGKKQIVFGNVFPLIVDEVYPVALDGAKLAGGLDIADREVGGEKSEGMVCACAELGMKQETLLKFGDADIGKSLPEIDPEFADVLFDIDNKSLTHRPDLMGHRGMAREVSAIFGKKLTLPTAKTTPGSGAPVKVEIQTDRCRRFTTAQMSGITVAPSPLGTQVRLENLGTRAISNLVDITNLILLGHGQPMHVFDAAKLDGKIIVRQAKNGEKLVALDGEEYELTSEDMVIADEKKVLSIAGIMGGEFSGVTEETTEIVFECANFDPVSIRKTSQRLGLRSESSMRYEKSLDPEQLLSAIQSAIELVHDRCPGATLTTPITDEYPTKFPNIHVDLPPQLVREKSGLEISDAEISKKLESLGFPVTATGATLRVEVPSWRATKDVAIPEDLVEEVVRLHGFGAVPSTLPRLSVTPPKKNWLRSLEWQMRDALATEGRNEVYLTSFVAPTDPEWIEQDDHVQVLNGANEEYQFLRKTLVSNAVRTMETELRTHGRLDQFEVGTTFDSLGVETRRLMVFSAEMQGDAVAKFYNLKSELIRVLRGVGQAITVREAASPSAVMHPAQAADVLIGEQVVGQIAVIHPAKNPVRGAAVVWAEIDLGAISPLVHENEPKFTAISAYPGVRRDLSIVLPESVAQDAVMAAAWEASADLEKIELFDVYRDAKKLGTDVKNLAFHLTFRSHDRTLDDAAIDQSWSAITGALSKKFNAELRLAFDQKNA